MNEARLFEDELRQFAQLQRILQEENATEQAHIDRIKALYEAAIADAQARIDANNHFLAERRAALEDEIRQHIIQNGSEGLHHTIHHSTRTEPVFDKVSALQQAIALGKSEFVRVKTELNLVPLKTALRNKAIDWIDDVTWQETTHVSFPKLGEFLLIRGAE